MCTASLELSGCTTPASEERLLSVAFCCPVNPALRAVAGAALARLGPGITKEQYSGMLVYPGLKRQH